MSKWLCPHCRICGKEMRFANGNKKYCSDMCKLVAYVKKKAGKMDFDWSLLD